MGYADVFWRRLKFAKEVNTKKNLKETKLLCDRHVRRLAYDDDSRTLAACEQCLIRQCMQTLSSTGQCLVKGVNVGCA